MPCGQRLIGAELVRELAAPIDAAHVVAALAEVDVALDCDGG
jgi:hypothetical protein